MKKRLILIVFFYILALLQASFLAPLSVPGKLPNLILVSVILFTFFEKPKENLAFFAAFLGGFFIDIFSSHLFGITTVFLLLLVFILKSLIHLLQKVTILCFLAISLFALILYNLFSEFFLCYLQSSFQFNFGMLFSIEIIYNFLLLLVIYSISYFFRRYVRS